MPITGRITVPAGVLSLSFRETVSTATSLTQRALRVSVLGTDVLVIGEATIGTNSNPCVE